MRLINIEPYEKHASAHMLCVVDEGKLVQVFSSDIPTIEAEPVKHGRWERQEDDECYWYECSECHNPPAQRFKRDYFSDYCPNCGAKMGLED